MLKIFQARLQQYMNREDPDVKAGFRKGRGMRDQIANIRQIFKKAREFQKNIYFFFMGIRRSIRQITSFVLIGKIQTDQLRLHSRERLRLQLGEVLIKYWFGDVGLAQVIPFGTCIFLTVYMFHNSQLHKERGSLFALYKIGCFRFDCELLHDRYYIAIIFLLFVLRKILRIQHMLHKHVLKK